MNRNFFIPHVLKTPAGNPGMKANRRDSARKPRDPVRGCFIAGCLCLSLSGLIGCSRPPAGYTEEMLLMGTTARITVVPDTPRNQDAAHKAFSLLNEYDRRFSFFSAQSELSQLNAAAATAAQKVSPDLFELIEKSLWYSGLTQGVFDVTATSLQRQSGYGSIIINKPENTVKFTDPKTKIDLGGIAVGYCIDKAASQLRGQGVENFLIDIGGDIIAYGRNADNQSWQIGLQDPFSSKVILASFPLNNEAVTTSGNYVKKHIIDPKAGTVSTSRVMSVAVFAPTCIDADALATTLFICGPGEQTQEIIRKVPGLRVVFVLDHAGRAELTEISSE